VRADLYIRYRQHISPITGDLVWFAVSVNHADLIYRAHYAVVARLKTIRHAMSKPAHLERF